MSSHRLPKLPALLQRKIYKTGQTRGADDDEIYQNRVGRNSTVLIPYSEWEITRPVINELNFEKGYIVLIPPHITDESSLRHQDLILGENCLYFYETRGEWDNFNPITQGRHYATSRISPLGGTYIARVPATTALTGGEKINHGFTQTNQKGAGIRFYEYASSTTIEQCRLQLEAIFWHCYDAMSVITNAGMSQSDAELRKKNILQQCNQQNLLNYQKLKQVRILDENKFTICPFCLEKISGHSFLTRLSQAEGREVPDLTITEVSLFHIEELRAGLYNHRPYNLGWGHHHCNVVVKDSGIMPTLSWIKSIINRNVRSGVEIQELE